MTTPNITREQIEEQIIQALDSIPAKEKDWLFSPELDDFLSLWYDLEVYYRLHTDTVISLDFIGTYCEFVKALRIQACDVMLEQNIRDRAIEVLDDLDAAMRQVVIAGVSNRDSPPINKVT